MHIRSVDEKKKNKGARGVIERQRGVKERERERDHQKRREMARLCEEC